MTEPSEGTEQFLEAAREYVEKSGGSGADLLPPYDEILEEDWGDVAQSLNRIDLEDRYIIHRDLLRYQYASEGHDLSEIRFTYPPLNETLFTALQAVDESEEEYDDPLAVAIGQAPLHPVYISPRAVHGLVRKIPLLDAFRAFLYDQLTPTPQYLVADWLKRESYQDALDLGGSLSQSTLNRLPERLDDMLLEYLQKEIERVAMNAQDLEIAEYVREPTPVRTAPDGKGVPPVTVITRDLRELTYPYLQFDRDESTVHSLDSFLSLLVSAAAHDEFVEEASNNQDLLPGVTGPTPTRRTLQYHLEKFSSTEITRRFAAANSVLFEEAGARGYFEEDHEIAIDITDWAYFGNEDENRLIQGTKPGRNYTYAWQFATLSLVGTNMPLTMYALPVRSQKNKGALVRRLIRASSEHVAVKRAYFDSEFYQTKVTQALIDTGTDFVMPAKKNSQKIDQLIDEAIENGLEWNVTRHGVGDIEDGRHWLIALPAEKKSQLRKSEPDDPHDDWMVLYTSIDPEEVDVEDEPFEHGAQKLGERFRRRWGIETSYRLIKGDYLPQTRSTQTQMRLFYFNFAVHLYNIWVVANIIRSEELGEEHDLAEEKVFTAKRVLQAIDYDPEEIDTDDAPDLSEVLESSRHFFW